MNDLKERYNKMKYINGDIYEGEWNIKLMWKG